MENKKWQERINYVVQHHSDGKISYTGQSVNYGGCICSSWKSVEDLQRKMKVMIEMYLEHGKKTIQEPLEMKELTHEEWEAKDDNIDYWEIERIKRILRRSTIQEKWKKIIGEEILEGEIERLYAGTVADRVIQALIDQENP